MLEDDITAGIKKAMKEGNKSEVSVLRMILSALKNKKIEEGVKSLEDDKVIDIIQKMARQHRESIEQFKQGGREDLVDKETEELVMLEAFLPEPLSEDEVDDIISSAITRAGAISIKDMGPVMKDVVEKVKGRADGKIISRKVREKLA